MRITTAIWFGIFMRRESARGAFVTVVRKGAQQAGVVFVIHRLGNGIADLYGPAPQSIFDDEPIERQFERVLEQADNSRIDEYLERQTKFDTDLWIVETEAGAGEVGLELVS